MPLGGNFVQGGSRPGSKYKRNPFKINHEEFNLNDFFTDLKTLYCEFNSANEKNNIAQQFLFFCKSGETYNKVSDLLNKLKGYIEQESSFNFNEKKGLKNEVVELYRTISQEKPFNQQLLPLLENHGGRLLKLCNQAQEQFELGINSSYTQHSYFQNGKSIELKELNNNNLS